jgi:YjjG family noncanonical pyrimidine nucleotidase
MKLYRCILFDLDHTLWDFETNSYQTLQELYHHHELESRGVSSFTHFYHTFVEINTRLWDFYDHGKITREKIRFERFHGILEKLGIDDTPLSLMLSDEYVAKAPKKSGLIPNSIEVLEYLFPRYPMTIITNGFEEIQYTKMESSGLTPYFKNVVTSARAGHKKPAKEIFEFALTEGGFQSHEALMIGDNLLTDIGGAHNASVDTVFFNPNKISHEGKPHFEIHDLKQLLDIL